MTHQQTVVTCGMNSCSVVCAVNIRQENATCQQKNLQRPMEKTRRNTEKNFDSNMFFGCLGFTETLEWMCGQKVIRWHRQLTELCYQSQQVIMCKVSKVREKTYWKSNLEILPLFHQAASNSWIWLCVPFIARFQSLLQDPILYNFLIPYKSAVLGVFF